MPGCRVNGSFYGNGIYASLANPLCCVMREDYPGHDKNSRLRTLREVGSRGILGVPGEL